MVARILPTLDERAKGTVGYVFNVGPAGVKLVDLRLLHIDAYNIEACFCEFNSERQANIAEAQYPHTGGFGLNLVVQIRNRRRSRGGSFLDHMCLLSLTNSEYQD